MYFLSCEYARKSLLNFSKRVFSILTNFLDFQKFVYKRLIKFINVFYLFINFM